MNLCIDSQSASVRCQPESLDALVDRLERLGYEPLLRKATHHLSSVFNVNTEDLLGSDQEEDLEDMGLQWEETRRRLLKLEKLGYKWGAESVRSQARVPETRGELFYAEDGAGLLFLTIVQTAGFEEGDSKKTECMLRAGFIGDSSNLSHLRELTHTISKTLEAMGIQCQWTNDDIRSQTHQELTQAGREGTLQTAASMTEKEMRAAKALENTSVREVAGLVRRAGVLLAKELLRQKADQATDIIRHVDQLLQVDLAHQEYVVVCSKSGAHVNRVESRDVIDQMARLGVLCSCGKPISEEQIEGLLAADELLPRMLEKNYWLTANIVRVLNSVNVPSDKILINANPLNDDVEIFADIEGTLVMFEPKDAEYGLSQAYSLGTRVSVHRPQLAVIVSTRGIGNEVKEHFKRIKPETQMVYVANLIQLDATVKKVVEGVRMARIKAWLNYYQGLLNFPLAPLMVPRIMGLSRGESSHVVTSVQIQPESAPASASTSSSAAAAPASTPQPAAAPAASASSSTNSGASAISAISAPSSSATDSGASAVSAISAPSSSATDSGASAVSAISAPSSSATDSGASAVSAISTPSSSATNSGASSLSAVGGPAGGLSAAMSGLGDLDDDFDIEGGDETEESASEKQAVS